MCMLDLDRAGCIVRGPRMPMDDDDEQVLTWDERLSLRFFCCEAWRAEMRCSLLLSKLPGLMRGSRTQDELCGTRSALVCYFFGNARGVADAVIAHQRDRLGIPTSVVWHEGG